MSLKLNLLPMDVVIRRVKPKATTDHVDDVPL
jgi:hypothetical protein